METEASVCQTIGFLLLDQFTLISLSCAVEPLRMANQLAGEELYRWQTISLDGQPVWASDGVSVTPDACAQDQRGFDAVIVCGGVGIQQAIQPCAHRLVTQPGALVLQTSRRGVHRQLGAGSGGVA